MGIFNPPHPGATLREDILPELALSVTAAAEQLGVTRSALSRVLNEHAAISIDMARRLEAWLYVDGRGFTAEMWLKLQLSYDLWQAQHHGQLLKVEPVKRSHTVSNTSQSRMD